MMNSIEGQNNLLRSARIARRWTPEFVSERVGVSRNTYIRWEAGAQVPRLSSLDALCRVFGSSPAELGFSDLLIPSHSGQKSACSDTEAQDHTEIRRIVVAGETTFSIGKQRLAADDDTNGCTGQPQKDEPDEPDELDPTLALAAMLRHWSAALSTYWQSFMNNGPHEIESPVSTCLVALNRPGLTPGVYQKEAASLSSQAYQLRALLYLHRGDFVSARADGMQALVYGQLAKDWNMYVAAQIRLAMIYSANRRIGAALNAYNDALRCVNAEGDHISPLLHCCIFAGLAEIQATMGRETEALQLLKLAGAVFPPLPAQDPCFLYMRCDRSLLYLYQGLVFLRLGRPKIAWEAFSQVEELHPAPEERVRVDFLRYRAYTSLVLGNMIQCCVYLEAATKAAQAIDSDLAQAEIYVLYQHVLASWGQEPRVQALAALFQR
jgi:Predicted transcriptional regulators